MGCADALVVACVPAIVRFHVLTLAWLQRLRVPLYLFPFLLAAIAYGKAPAIAIYGACAFFGAWVAQDIALERLAALRRKAIAYPPPPSPNIFVATGHAFDVVTNVALLVLHVDAVCAASIVISVANGDAAIIVLAVLGLSVAACDLVATVMRIALRGAHAEPLFMRILIRSSVKRGTDPRACRPDRFITEERSDREGLLTDGVSPYVLDVEAVLDDNQ